MRNSQLDVAKAIATLLVVMGYVLPQTNKSIFIDFESYEMCIRGLKNLLYTFHMPFFFFTSGLVYNFARSNGKYTNSYQFITNKTQRLIIPYLLFGSIFVFPVCVFVGIWQLDVQSFYQHLILGNDSRHLWFLPTLFFIFCLSQFYTKVLEKRKIVSLILLSALHFSHSLLPNDFFISSVAFYWLYFQLGVFVQEKRITFECKKAPSFVITAILVTGLSITNEHIIENGFLHSLINRACSLIGITFLLVSGNLFKNSSFCALISNFGMGIYLFHPIYIYLLSHILQYFDIELHILLYIAISFIVSVLVSILSTLTLRRLNAKILIGE